MSRLGWKPKDVKTEATLREALAKAERERDEARRALQKVSPIHCSFCGKNQHEVEQMIAGPRVFICDGCVDLCVDIIREKSQPADPAKETEGAE